MTGFKSRLIAVMSTAILLTTALARPAIAQSVAPAAHNASIKTYLPDLQRLQQKADWAGLEQLSRRALSDLRLRGSGADVQSAALFLGEALRNERYYGEAESLYRSLLASDEQVLGMEHP